MKKFSKNNKKINLKKLKEYNKLKYKEYLINLIRRRIFNKKNTPEKEYLKLHQAFINKFLTEKVIFKLIQEVNRTDIIPDPDKITFLTKYQHDIRQ
jgi:hypothetical protein